MYELQISEALERIDKRLQRIEQNAFDRDKPFLSIDEASQYTKIPKATLYIYVSKGIISYHKLNNRRVYFRVEDLNNFLINKKNRFKSNTEIESEAMTKVVNK